MLRAIANDLRGRAKNLTAWSAKLREAAKILDELPKGVPGDFYDPCSDEIGEKLDNERIPEIRSATSVPSSVIIQSVLNSSALVSEECTQVSDNILSTPRVGARDTRRSARACRRCASRADYLSMALWGPNDR